ncbi:MAG: hypothetical protein AAGA03_03435 [Planctomycetota bacterium]
MRSTDECSPSSRDEWPIGKRLTSKSGVDPVAMVMRFMKQA